MKTQKIWFVLGLAAVLALAACSGSPLSSAGDKPAVRQLTAAGQGKVYLVPDLAMVSIGVHSEAATVGEALKNNNAQADAIQKALVALGIDAKDIQTSVFNVYPQQRFDQKGEPSSTIYVVDNTVSVTVRDLSKLGGLLDKVVASGANSIHGIQFDVKDKSKAVAEARKMAIDDARSQAQALAQDAGVQLGPLQTLNVSQDSQMNSIALAKGGMVAADTSVPVSSGQFLITMDATLTYEIK